MRPAGFRSSRWLSAPLILVFVVSFAATACRQDADSPRSASDLARVRPDIRNGAVNSLWKYDADPNLQSLDAHKTVTLADLKGPAQINTIYIGEMMSWETSGTQMDPAEPRAIVLKIFFDGAERPAVEAPLGDFFADGNGKAGDFTTQFVERSRGSYVCYIPMPFKKSALVTLTNESDRDISSFAFVEWQTLPRWEADLGYFHAAWRRHSFQLTPETQQSFFQIDGPGHLVGEYWLIQTDEPLFADMNFVMEGNNELRVDGESRPSINYLGSECAFDFGWGWRTVFNGYKVGVNFHNPKAGETAVSVYRFRDRDVIRFREKIALIVNWGEEFKTIPALKAFRDRIQKRNMDGGGWVDYSETTYWYSLNPEGSGVRLPPLVERVKPLLHPNPPADQKSP
jgi:hypothetical protein